MKKYLMIMSVMASLLVFANQSMADSYTFYDNIANQKLGKAAEKDKKIMSFKYSNGVLVILGTDGKKLDLKDGIYKMNNGELFYVESGAVVKHEEGKKKKDKKEDGAKSKIKGLL
ncbi:MAG: hypothetical protein JXA04_10310 [Gammaproteobacteria bacterium]|nr:hypothetical protein [Gammaproteobacteria bacterium]